jgi:hypothetical protein
MSQRLEQSVEALMADIASREAEILTDKRTVNRLAKRLGHPEPYALPDVKPTRPLPTQVVRMDQFANEPTTAAAVHAFLRFRGRESGPQSFKTIFDMLTYGGFRFGGGDLPKREAALREALATDRHVRRLGEDWFALVERPRVVAPRTRARTRNRRSSGR